MLFSIPNVFPAVIVVAIPAEFPPASSLALDDGSAGSAGSAEASGAAELMAESSGAAE